MHTNTMVMNAASELYLGAMENAVGGKTDTTTKVAVSGLSVGTFALTGGIFGSFAGPVGTAVGAAVGGALGGAAAAAVWIAEKIKN